MSRWAVLTLASFLIALVAGAQQRHATLQSGDIVAGGQTPTMITAFGRFDWFLPDGTLNKREPIRPRLALRNRLSETFAHPPASPPVTSRPSRTLIGTCGFLPSI